MSERLEIFRRKVEESPRNSLFRFSLGQALFENDNFEEAEKEFFTCLEDREDWMMALILRARCLIELGRAEEAKQCLRDAVLAARNQNHEDPEREATELLQRLEGADSSV